MHSDSQPQSSEPYANAGAPHAAAGRRSLREVAQRCVEELGFEFVDLELMAAQHVRVTIDVAGASAVPGAPQAFVTVQDCEKVSHQLSHELLVEDFDYDRLEVSSPGLDRPLKKEADFIRFSGLPISLKLRTMVGGRRHFEGQLEALEDGRFSVTYAVQPASALPRSPSRRTTKAKAPAMAQVVFRFSDVERARLVPQVQFQGG
jgi:ribosome maturation factor RimP